MRSLNATQLSLIAASSKRLTWLFTITTLTPTTYRWSTKAVSFGGNNYSFKIIPNSFSGITLNRAMSELGIQAPSTLSFDIPNSGSTLAAADFIGATVQVDLVLSDWTNEAICATWKFRVISCTARYQRLSFICEDFIQQYLRGDYPKTALVKELAPSTDASPDDNLCVPLPFGEAYVPLRSVYVSADSQRFYVLGPQGVTYTVSLVHSPRDWPGKSEWSSAGFTFTQYDKTLSGVGYRVLEPIIADSDSNGTADAMGLWKQGDKFLDMPAQFTRSDTSALTGPAAVLEHILEDFGVPSADLDTGVGSTFAAAATTYASWGLTWNGALFTRESRQRILARLLAMCHSTLVITDKVELHVLSAASVDTVAKADVVRSTITGQGRESTGEGTFRRQGATSKTVNDSGYGAFQEADTPQDTLLKFIVAADATTASPASGVLELPWIQDSQVAQKLAILHYQRALLRKETINFDAKLSLLALQPDDVITISDAAYGGTYDALIESITIRREGRLTLSCVTFTSALDDWTDLSPSAITYADDGSTYTYTTVVVGPDGSPTSGQVPNAIQGRLRMIDGTAVIVLDPAALSIALFDGATEKARLGDLTGIAGASGYGLWTSNGFFTGTVTATAGAIGGWTIAATTLTGGNAILSSTGALTLGTGNDVVILSAADATYRLWIGNATAASAPFRVSKTGVTTIAADANNYFTVTPGGSIALVLDSGGVTISETGIYFEIPTVYDNHRGLTWGTLGFLNAYSSAGWVMSEFRMYGSAAYSGSSMTVSSAAYSGGTAYLYLTADANGATHAQLTQLRLENTGSTSYFQHTSLTSTTATPLSSIWLWNIYSSGTPAVGLGGQMQIKVQTAAGPTNYEYIYKMWVELKNVTAGAEDGQLTFDYLNNGASTTYCTVYDGLSSWFTRLLVKPASNSVTAFQVQNASATGLFTCDTTNLRVGFGTATSPSYPVHAQNTGSWTAMFDAITTSESIMAMYLSCLATNGRAHLFLQSAHASFSMATNIADAGTQLQLIADVNAANPVIHRFIECSSAPKGLSLDCVNMGGGGTKYNSMTWDIYGNVGIGVNSFGTSANRVLGFTNSGAAPSSSPANMAQMWCEDVSSSAELRVRDEGGTVSTISPHNFTLFQPAADEPLPWSHYSENAAIGKRINVDMAGAVREVERLSGKQFIYLEDIPVTEDWRSTQREAAIEDYIRTHTYELETSAEDALAAPEPVEVEDTNAKPTGEEISGYRLNPDGSVTAETRPKRPTKQILHRKLREDCRFDSRTGKLLRTIKPTRQAALAALGDIMTKDPAGPAWLIARLPKPEARTGVSRE